MDTALKVGGGALLAVGVWSVCKVFQVLFSINYTADDEVKS